MTLKQAGSTTLTPTDLISRQPTMRFSATVAGMAAALAPATVLAGDDHKVPGESPLMFCPGEVPTDVVTIKRVDLTPNPPKVNSNLTIAVTVVVNQVIERGTYVQLLVKLGPISLISMRKDVCDEVRNVDLQCPIQPGVLHIEKIVEMPPMIPPQHYFAQASVFTTDDRSITCLNAHVDFTHHTFPNIELR